MSKVFIDRRKGNDRRLEIDRCKDIPLDLFHRKRRKSTDRRALGRSLSEDYFAFIEAQQGAGQSPCDKVAACDLNPQMPSAAHKAELIN
ncbi:MAG: hypothetical protein OIF35_03120 [Cellvibrionaceae bacterium]|nr:hypothetical protein [Cellvibrionaceae bacterium]